MDLRWRLSTLPSRSPERRRLMHKTAAFYGVSQQTLYRSDLKHLKAPAWMDDTRGAPTLMLFSVVDDRSGVAYQEYHCAYGEAVEVALQFL